MSKYLITGGCGFIGSHLADTLIECGNEVRILDDLSTGKRVNAPKGAELLIGSVTDLKLLEQALEGIEGVYHLAAIASVQKTIEKWHETHLINQGGTVAILEQIARSKRTIPVVYASSSAVYGNTSHYPISEETPQLPLSPYGVDKLACEWQARIAWNVHKIPSIGLRLFNVFGPRQDPSSPYSGVIAIFSKRIPKGDPITIYGDGEQRRDFIYVKDVVRIMVKAMSKTRSDAEIYNVCTGKDISVNQLAEIIGKLSRTQVEKQYAPPREGEVRISCGDPSKIKHALQLEASFTIEEGLKQCV